MGISTKIKRFWKTIGPGLVTGASDDDPSGIATYSQAGAQFGLMTLWTTIITIPLMAAIQQMCARIGLVTSQGLTGTLKKHYSKPILYVMLVFSTPAIVMNIGADIAAIGSALNLLIPLPVMVLSTISVVIILALEIFVGYHTYSKYLKLLALTLISYVITAIIVNPNWTEVVKSFFIPKISWTADYWYVIVALIGTTISPYMFFWQATEEVEEQKYAIKAGIPKRSLKVIRRDNTLGMTISQIGSLFMIITTAVVLHSNGVTEIGTAADAAKALEPLVSGFPDAGLYAKILFTLGIIGMGLLGIPVLAGSVSYAISDTRNWPQGLDFKFAQAKQFYVVIILATGAGWIMNAIGIDPMKALVFAAVINGLVSIPLIFLISRISKNSEVMGIHTGGPLSRTMLMLTFFVTLAAGLILGISLLRG